MNKKKVKVKVKVNKEINVKKLEKDLKEKKKERTTLPEYSFFGDNNWEQLDIEIEYLEKLIENPTIGTVEDLKMELEDKAEEVENDYIDNGGSEEEMIEMSRPYLDLINTIEEYIK